ncbi:MAG: hypothetical protein RBR02_09520 [Desulfuromonadaceae bacterium]|nr:hypothetical protein [Desulfuromonadaceae bacterium]
MKDETRKALIISIIVVLVALFLYSGEEMASVIIGKGGTLHVDQFEDITVQYDVLVKENSSYCDMTLYLTNRSNSQDETIMGSYTHYNVKYPNRMIGSFGPFNVSKTGNYTLVLESSYPSGSAIFTKTNMDVHGISWNNSTNGTPGSSDGSGNSTGGGSVIVITQNGSNSSGIEIISGNDSSGAGGSSNDTQNSSSGNDDDGNNPEFKLPEKITDLLKNFIKNLKKLLNGEISLLDVFKALLKALSSGDFWDILLYFLIVIIIIAIAVVLVYVILKIFLMRYLTR